MREEYNYFGPALSEPNLSTFKRLIKKIKNKTIQKRKKKEIKYLAHVLV